MHKSKCSSSLPPNNPPSKLKGTNNHKLDGNKFLATDYATFETHQLLDDSQHLHWRNRRFRHFLPANHRSAAPGDPLGLAA